MAGAWQVPPRTHSPYTAWLSLGVFLWDSSSATELHETYIINMFEMNMSASGEVDRKSGRWGKELDRTAHSPRKLTANEKMKK